MSDGDEISITSCSSSDESPQNNSRKSDDDSSDYENCASFEKELEKEMADENLKENDVLVPAEITTVSTIHDKLSIDDDCEKDDGSNAHINDLSNDDNMKGSVESKHAANLPEKNVTVPSKTNTRESKSNDCAESLNDKKQQNKEIQKNTVKNTPKNDVDTKGNQIIVAQDVCDEIVDEVPPGVRDESKNVPAKQQYVGRKENVQSYPMKRNTSKNLLAEAAAAKRRRTSGIPVELGQSILKWIQSNNTNKLPDNNNKKKSTTSTPALCGKTPQTTIKDEKYFVAIQHEGSTTKSVRDAAHAHGSTQSATELSSSNGGNDAVDNSDSYGRLSHVGELTLSNQGSNGSRVNTRSSLSAKVAYRHSTPNASSPSTSNSSRDSNTCTGIRQSLCKKLTSFKGSNVGLRCNKDNTNMDCIAIYDHERGCYVLEIINESIVLNKCQNNTLSKP